MNKKVLIIYAHPDKESYNVALGKAYLNGLKVDKKEIKEIFLNDLDFDLRQKGYKSDQKLEKDLENVQKKILWADHITFVYPIWWFNFPAILKAFFDRVLSPRFSYKYEGKILPTGLLKPRTARAIVTLDAPLSYYRFIVGAPEKTIFKNVMSFNGVKVIGHHYYGSIRKSTEEKRKTWLGETYSLGLKE